MDICMNMHEYGITRYGAYGGHTLAADTQKFVGIVIVSQYKIKIITKCGQIELTVSIIAQSFSQAKQ